MAPAIPHPSLALFNPATQSWFQSVFPAPTAAQAQAWPAIANGDSTLLLAPTGSGKTLAAFLQCLDRLMFHPLPPAMERCRVLYVSPLKALAVDVERNLRAPLAGITQWASQRGDTFVVPEIAVRTGDTSASDRARFGRAPSDILITTPESLYLLLTSNARASLRFVDTVILDEIHALVPTKRGAHLAMSLERLQALTGKPLQRIGLSATQRPLEEVARFLGGAEVAPRAEVAQRVEAKVGQVPSRENRVDGWGHRPDRSEIPGVRGSGEDGPPLQLDSQLGTGESIRYRPVTLVNAGERKALSIKVEVPVEDMASLTQPLAVPSGAASQGEARPSIWTALHPRLLELVKSHTSTLIFVNSRRVSERLAGALNELAGEILVHAHHGSIARAQRQEIEDALKAGRVKGLVATSSLELGIDMGAIDLVVQIEAPPSVASGLQRIGRAGHQVGGHSEGILFPKFRADLVACAALTRAMRDGEVERSRYIRNPLDILAQHIVAMVGMDPWNADALYAAVRGAAPFADLRRTQFEGVLDLLAGRYETEEFADLRPRIVWDRVTNEVTAREGARRVAVVNGGTIPDRGLYGVFLAGAERKGARVGELDEEMVHESRVGETFILGASTWRIEEITHDRVLVSPAPGQPGKMPFWKGDAAGRPLEVGQRIGKLVRELRALPETAAVDRLTRLHDLDERAANNVLQYLNEQAQATQVVPDDRTIVIERLRDELGDWRVCVLSPLGGQVHAPWSMAIAAKLQSEQGIQAESLWSNDGFVIRFPDTDAPPDSAWMLPTAEEVEGWVMNGLAGSSLLAARFRENAARALLLPRRRPGMRTPLWKQRRRSADLLKVASQFPSFPMLLETYRECLRDLFDLPALRSVLRDTQTQAIQVVTVDSRTPSPFASTLLFGYAANYLYDGDAPLAERRVQALAIDQAQLKELLGDAELRELLDADVLEELEQELQHLAPGFKAKSTEGVHDLLRRLGDLSWEELLARCETPDVAAGVQELLRARRVVAVQMPGRGERFLTVEDVARYRDGLGVPAPSGIPEVLLRPVADARADLVLRFGRTHGPFTLDELAQRHAVPRATFEPAIRKLVASGRLLEGAFRPRGLSQELCEAEVLRGVRRRSLAKLRREVEPVPPSALGRFVARWQGVTPRRRGLDALLDSVEKLQGFPLPASVLESEILPARMEGYTPADLDALMAAGELVWTGVEPLGERDGRIALYLTDALPRLWMGVNPTAPEPSERAQKVLAALRAGAAFFPALHAAAGSGSLQETVSALWELVWSGRITNDSLRPLRAFLRGTGRSRKTAGPQQRAFRSRRAMPPPGEGRWSLLENVVQASSTERATALASQLLVRHGLVTREVASVENVPGGFSSVYAVLKGLEDAGRTRRGYFVTGVGAAQFAQPAALETLRSFRQLPETPERWTLSAVDPANPYGVLLPWPPLPGDAARGPSRSAGAHVVLVNGQLAAALSKGGRQLWSYLPPDEPERSQVGRAAAQSLAELIRRPESRLEGVLIEEINGGAALDHAFVPFLKEVGFMHSLRGLHLRRGPIDVVSPADSLLQDALDDQTREDQEDA